MANLIKATVRQIDGSPLQPSSAPFDFQTSNIVIKEASIGTIPAVQSVIFYYNVVNNQQSVQQYFVEEDIATLVSDANSGSTSQVQVTVLEINGDPQVPGGIQYSFPANEILVSQSINPTTGVNSCIQFKNVKYFVSESDSAILSAANSGGAGVVTSVSANQGLQVNNTNPANPIVYIGYTAENVANKSTDVNLSANSDTLYPSQKAVKTYADGLVTGLLDDRGNYNASSNLFPSTGGSGTAGAILKGDLWFISVGGTLGGTPVLVGSSVRALVDSPGQTSTNWDILDTGVGYTPENVINKSTDGTFAANSDTLYPSQKAVKTYISNNAGPGGYKVYTALVTLNFPAGTFTVQQLKNTLGNGSNDGINDIAWSYSAFGTAYLYADMSSAPFVSGKVWISATMYNNSGQPYMFIGRRQTTTRLIYDVFKYDGTQTNMPFFQNLFVEIRVYN